ncbi:hypothetical protein GCM10010233_12220 [Streptomyces pseudogriseolus]|nr:hypothetical protein GCM10010233_12220 [Streptomyces gancidicus]
MYGARRLADGARRAAPVPGAAGRVSGARATAGRRGGSRRPASGSRARGGGCALARGVRRAAVGGRWAALAPGAAVAVSGTRYPAGDGHHLASGVRLPRLGRRLRLWLAAGGIRRLAGRRRRVAPDVRRLGGGL